MEHGETRLLLRVSWQPDRASRPTLVLIHGLEGCDRSSSLLCAAIHAFRSGFNVARMNMRGCGDGLELCPRIYNAGRTKDVLAVMEWAAARSTRVALCGFSLGAGLTLHTLSSERQRIPEEVRAVVAVCPPLDMSAAADALEAPGNGYYSRRFTRSLCASYRRRQRASPERYDEDADRGVTTVREFDELVTARYAGYRGAEHYYETVSAGPGLISIGTPTLVIASGNDPFIPAASVTRFPLAESVRLELVEDAGHVGFVAGADAPRWFWAAERMVAFLRQGAWAREEAALQRENP